MTLTLLFASLVHVGGRPKIMGCDLKMGDLGSTQILFKLRRSAGWDPSKQLHAEIVLNLPLKILRMVAYEAKNLLSCFA